MKMNIVSKQVENTFTDAGYTVSINVIDEGTAEEVREVACMIPSSSERFEASHSYDSDWANLVRQSCIAAAKANNVVLKEDNLDGYLFYFGTPRAMELFESLGDCKPVILFSPAEKEENPLLDNLTDTLKANDYTVTKLEMGDGFILTCQKSSDLFIAGCGSNEWYQTYAIGYKETAKALNHEMKQKENWFYFGAPEAVEIFENVIEK